MNPGVSVRPAASTTVSPASGSRSPPARMRSPSIRTSPERAAAPVPSTIEAFTISVDASAAAGPSAAPSRMQSLWPVINMREMENNIAEPWLLFLGDAPDIGWAKTAAGICQWRRERCAGQLRLPGCGVNLGLPDLAPARAVERGIRTMIIGIANDGGYIAKPWIP